MTFTRRENILIFIGYVMLVWCTIPIAPKLYAVMVNMFGSSFRTYMNFIFLATAFSIFYFLYKRMKELGGMKLYIASAILLSVSAYLVIFLTPSAGQQFHLAEYMFMGFFAIRALKGIKSRDIRYLTAAIVISIIATIDEIVIQRYLPNRSGMFGHVALDILGSLLGLEMVRLFDTEKDLRGLISIKFEDLLKYLTWASLAAILIFFSSTSAFLYISYAVFFLSWFLRKLLLKEGLPIFGRENLLVLAFLLSLFFSSMDASSTKLAVSHFIFFLSAIVVYVITKDLIRNKAIFYILSSLVLFESIIIFSLSFKERAGSIYYLSSIILPIAVTMAVFLRKRKITFSFLSVISLVSIALCLGYSGLFKFAALISVSGLILSVIIFNKRVMAVSVILLLLSGALYINKIDVEKQNPGKLIEVEKEAYRKTFYLFMERPFFGVGPGIIDEMAKAKEGRSLYSILEGIRFLFEAGLIGAGLILSFLILLLVRVRRYLESAAEGLPKYIVTGCALSLILFLVSVSFDRLASPGSAALFIALILGIVSSAIENSFDVYPEKIY